MIHYNNVHEEEPDMTEPQILVDPPREANTHKRRPAWGQGIIQDEEKNGALDETSRESKRPRTHSNYVALLCDIIDADPSSYEEPTEKKEWKDTMIKEYQSIMKNDV